MKRHFSLAVAVIMSLTIFCVPTWGDAAFASEEEQGVIATSEVAAPVEEVEAVEEEPAVKAAEEPVGEDVPFRITPESVTIDWTYEEYNFGYWNKPIIDCDGSQSWNCLFSVTPVTESKIVEATSSNTNVISLEDNRAYGYYVIVPKAAGTAVITCEDEFGNTATCTITVPASYINSYIVYDTLFYGSVQSGEIFDGSTLPGAVVSVKVAGKTYTKKANSSGEFAIAIPVVKIGSAATVSIRYGNATKTYNWKVYKSQYAFVCLDNNIYRSTKKAYVYVDHAHKGDVVTLKIGKKKYKKTIKTNGDITYKQKIKKPKKWGKKITITVKNKYGQTIATSKSRVYFKKKLKKGMTKKQVLCVPDWEYPDERIGDGKETFWNYYDAPDTYEGTYLYFYKGRLRGWHRIT